MKEAYVYKVTRADDLSYIGITVNPKTRFKAHSRSNRFSIGIKSFEILHECDSYEIAEELEEKCIEFYNTFENGLNLTCDGKAGDGRINTLGHKYTDSSRKKMSDSAKRRGPNTIGFKFSEDTKEKWSEVRKGKRWGKAKLNDEQVLEIYNSFLNDTVKFDIDFVKRYVKSSQHSQIDMLSFDELVTKNGLPLSKEALYCNYYAEMYKVTSSAIRAIIKNKGVRCEPTTSKE
jgi:hypothetical protein